MPDTPCFERQPLNLRADPVRVVVRPFRPGEGPRDHDPVDNSRINRLVDRVLALSPADVATVLARTLDSFADRHHDLAEMFARRAQEMAPAYAHHKALSADQRLVIGACFLHEYSFEAAALFNPSIVAHPDQTGVAAGHLRFILSLRAVGEGHISSLTFRSGVIAADGSITIDQPEQCAVLPTVTARAGDRIDLAFDAHSDITERVIFPITAAQAHGIEDARFVAFADQGVTTWYATYTAYDGVAIRSELLETRDFATFRLTPLAGAAAASKGMALFPRKIAGRYAMIARIDNENLQLIYSDNLLDWGMGDLLLAPMYPWEFVQIGNCGSPIELDEGWLLFTHGVGPMRHYAIGAVLLDKQDPSRVIGRAREPLVEPENSERQGYVPNVVYSCGALRVGDRIVLPYAVSDAFSTFATIRIDDLVAILKQGMAAPVPA
ncbi:glycoside hydrolase family 130 protein [Novosphingobium sp.]|uniref:glycoside hydrolase family 130 protein n=1 Tax=Novosphingobium sp. TaxID=1874826 RepID=UPI00334127A3